MTGRDSVHNLWKADPVDPADAERIRSAAVELERYVRATDLAPRVRLGAQIMETLEAEPVPAPLTALGAAARGRRLRAMLSALGDAWRVAWSGGRPIAIRLSAAVAVLVLVVAVGSLGGLAAVGAWSVLQPERPTPSPSVDLVPVVVPPVDSEPSRIETPATAAPGPTPTPSPSPHVTEPTAPARTPRPTVRPTPTPRVTARPTHPPERTPVPEGTHHPEPTHPPETIDHLEES
jgi:hypothetical protein